MFAIGDKEYPGLGKLAEEAGELLQVIGKLMATHGGRQHWDGTDLRARLVDEMADVYAAIQFVRDVVLRGLEARCLDQRVREKLATFCRWHREQDPILPERSEDCDRGHLVGAAESTKPREMGAETPTLEAPPLDIVCAHHGRRPWKGHFECANCDRAFQSLDDTAPYYLPAHCPCRSGETRPFTVRPICDLCFDKRQQEPS